jgi:hypothetical protein
VVVYKQKGPRQARPLHGSVAPSVTHQVRENETKRDEQHYELAEEYGFLPRRHIAESDGRLSRRRTPLRSVLVMHDASLVGKIPPAPALRTPRE